MKTPLFIKFIKSRDITFHPSFASWTSFERILYPHDIPRMFFLVTSNTLARIAASTVFLSLMSSVLGSTGMSHKHAVKVCTLFHHCVCGPAALYLFMREYGSASLALALHQDRAGALWLVNHWDPATVVVGDVFVGYLIFDLIEMKTWSNQEFLLMMAHHLIGIVVVPLVGIAGWFQGFTMYFISTEITSIFNVIRTLLLDNEMKQSIVYKLNGMLFTLVFVIVRMAPVPLLFLAWYLAPQPTSTTKVDSYGATYAYALSYLSILHPGAHAIFVMNLYWGFKVIRGFVSAMSQPKSKRN